MGCVSSKQAVSVTPAFDVNVPESGRKRPGLGDSGRKKAALGESRSDLGVARSGCGSESIRFRTRNLHKYVEGEQVAAGWPAWLSAVAGEAIRGWLPLRAEAFEKLEKIGQGTYSTVFRARELETGRIVALKKVRFDNFEPESVRFMAREIALLRRLDHPNIVKLEGLITSRISCSLYLVFEYSDHDLSGLLACPTIKFSEPQIKCYMEQLLSGLDHCHSRGVMHRDIKGANLLINNEGILKVADFGLANFTTCGYKQPLTSRVVTLWYRPPELLLGATDYGPSVDIWSFGCVFAEILLGYPILQGRTEVEQLHKIFKLCGSPPDDYWKKSKLPHATLFRPQQPYESCLRETFKDLPPPAVHLIETCLLVDPRKRGTAASALTSEYFTTIPYACDPSTLPKYPPNKEMDAKHREDAKRKKTAGRVRVTGAANKTTRKPDGINKLAPTEDLLAQNQVAYKCNGNIMEDHKKGNDILGGELPKPPFYLPHEVFHSKNASQGDIPFSGSLQMSTSRGFTWGRRNAGDPSTRSHSRSNSKCFEPPTAPCDKNSCESKKLEKGDAICRIHTNSKGRDSYGLVKDVTRKRWGQLECPDSFDASAGYHSQELSLALYQKEEINAGRDNLDYHDQGDKVEFSGPLLSQSHRVDELLAKHERRIRQAVRRSWFHKGKLQGK